MPEERQAREVGLQDCQVLQQHHSQMSQDSKETLPCDIILIQPSFLPQLPCRALVEALLPLLHPWPDLLEKLSRRYWLSLRQEVTTLIAGEPRDPPQELLW